jgi:flagellar basal-body rod protein FlgG
MSSALHIARTGLDAQDMRMRVISNNLANVNTTGFKKDRADFETLLYQNYRPAGAATSESTEAPTGLQIGTGVRISGTQRLHTQGGLTTTGNALDLALDGPGFFRITMPDGRTAYTRDGSFKLAADGRMVTTSGYPLDPAVSVPPGATGVTIAPDGTVSATLAGESAATELGTLTLADFPNAAGLQPLSENLFAETAASGAALDGQPGLDGRGRIAQGALETSNVNVVAELVEMIETQRAYEINSKVITAVDGMLRYATQNL